MKAEVGPEGDNQPVARTSKERLSPRPVGKRQPPDAVIRCRLCDWQLIDGEGITRTRPCCVAGLQFDLDHGLTLIGGKRTYRAAPETSEQPTPHGRSPLTGWCSTCQSYECRAGHAQKAGESKSVMTSLPLNENLMRLRKRFDDSGKPFTRAHIQELFNEARALSQDLSNVQGQLDAAERHVKILTDQRAPQAPIANLIIDENGECSAACMYAPGLPAGSHDVYLDPAAPGLPALRSPPQSTPYDPTNDVILLKMLNQIGTVKPGFDAALAELRQALHVVPAGAPIDIG